MKQYRPTWIKHPIESQKHCNILLTNGYRLRNSTGGIVSLDAYDNQKVQQTHKQYKRQYYRFSSPWHWEVIDNENKAMEVKITLMMKFMYFIGKVL